jgi:hypothetical protein
MSERIGDVTIFPVKDPTWAGDYWRVSLDSILEYGEYVSDRPSTAWWYRNWVGEGALLTAYRIESPAIFDATGDEGVEEIAEESGIEIHPEINFVASALEEIGVSEALAKEYDLVKFDEIEPPGTTAYKYIGGETVKGTVIARYELYGDQVDLEDIFDESHQMAVDDD